MHNALYAKIFISYYFTEKIAWDQASWSEAAKTDPKLLNLDEFLTFRHPESSHSNLLNKADEILGEYDRDADELLTWEEYSSISDESILVKRSEKRRDEFDNFMDRNRDGKLDKREILVISIKSFMYFFTIYHRSFYFRSIWILVILGILTWRPNL